jgi:catechol 2,3-dioxygenase-like lactoylglutathione lyase family enzyme
LDVSIQFYTQVLGFQLDWRGGEVCSVSRDGRPIMLKQSAGDNTPAWVWIGLESDALFHLYGERGVKIRQEPMNWSWAYEMKFEDPDGNVLWLGTEPRGDLPKQDHA